MSSNLKCQFSLDQCLPPDFYDPTTDASTTWSAESMFTRMAFDRPQCGDCLIDALVIASGAVGLSAFLPDEGMVFHPRPRDPQLWERSEPILPLVPDWRDGRYALADVVRPGQDTWHGVEARSDGGVKMREWCIKLLSRYAYTLGTFRVFVFYVPTVGTMSLCHFSRSRLPSVPSPALTCSDHPHDVHASPVAHPTDARVRQTR